MIIICGAACRKTKCLKWPYQLGITAEASLNSVLTRNQQIQVNCAQFFTYQALVAVCYLLLLWDTGTFFTAVSRARAKGFCIGTTLAFGAADICFVAVSKIWCYCYVRFCSLRCFVAVLLSCDALQSLVVCDCFWCAYVTHSITLELNFQHDSESISAFQTFWSFVCWPSYHTVVCLRYTEPYK